MPARQITRREWIGSVTAGGIGMALTSPLHGGEPSHKATPPPPTALEALARLKEGNRRFVEGRSSQHHETSEWRKQLLGGQNPIAVIVGCSDSRVPIELIFDQGFGDLFVIRNAGNIVTSNVLASIEYAVDHLDTRLVVVMGHEGCGAVTAAMTTKDARAREAIDLQLLLRRIDEGLLYQATPGDHPRTLHQATEANMRWGVKQLTLRRDESSTHMPEVIEIVGANYELKTGRVRFIDEPQATQSASTASS